MRGQEMKIYVFPADLAGCGYLRMIWPAEALKARGHDIEIVSPKSRNSYLNAGLDSSGKVASVDVPADADVIVLQRVTNKYVVQAIPLIRKKGIAVVVDIDDDLSAIDPNNPAFAAMHPKYGVNADHNWKNCEIACDNASWVQVSTPALLERYARHGRGSVVYNCIPSAWLQMSRLDSPHISWAGSLHSHPGDLDVVGIGVANVLSDSVRYRAVGPVEGVQQALRLPYEPAATGPLELTTGAWAAGLQTIGVGIAPLADNRFNAGKSWLKPLEYSALGVPWVASPRVEYKRLHSLGAGLLADKPKKWMQHLRALTQSAEMRNEHSMMNRAVASQWTLELRCEQWLEAWESGYKAER
jgi:hypothetical protein